MNDKVKDIKKTKDVKQEDVVLSKDVCLAAIKFLDRATTTGYTEAAYLVTVVNEIKRYAQHNYPE